jgi:LmbE family N-acetylglucosaminyl deacetylase
VYNVICEEVKRGRTVVCAYLTDGGAYGSSVEVRNRESLSVLARLGVAEKNVHFAGPVLGIADASLPENLGVAATWLQAWLTQFSAIAAIYVPAWEGGHHDHDALHAIMIKIAEKRKMLHVVRQFSLYNGYRCSGAMFRVLTALPENGEVDVDKISWARRAKFLMHCMSYPSQFRSWLGLLPFVALHYLFRGTQEIQRVSMDRINNRPHSGALYYERRNFYTWEKMHEKISQSVVE